MIKSTDMLKISSIPAYSKAIFSLLRAKLVGYREQAINMQQQRNRTIINLLCNLKFLYRNKTPSIPQTACV